VGWEVRNCEEEMRKSNEAKGAKEEKKDEV
jgi:hypothetical protein